MHLWPENKKVRSGWYLFVLNFQGCAKCATGVACKSLNKKMKQITDNYVILYIYLDHLKNAIVLEPIRLPEKGF